MTQPRALPATQATELVLRNLNAAGAPGTDPQFGNGIIDVGRVVNSQTPGIYDGAIASNWYVAPENGAVTGMLLVTVENRGTEPITNGTVNVEVNNGTFQLMTANLLPGQTQVLTLPVNAPGGSIESVPVESTLTIRNGLDSKPSNDSLAGQIVLVPLER
jgi:hypothetical protein